MHIASFIFIVTALVVVIDTLMLTGDLLEWLIKDIIVKQVFLRSSMDKTLHFIFIKAPFNIGKGIVLLVEWIQVFFRILVEWINKLVEGKKKNKLAESKKKNMIIVTEEPVEEKEVSKKINKYIEDLLGGYLQSPKCAEPAKYRETIKDLPEVIFLKWRQGEANWLRQKERFKDRVSLERTGTAEDSFYIKIRQPDKEHPYREEPLKDFVWRYIISNHLMEFGSNYWLLDFILEKAKQMEQSGKNSEQIMAMVEAHRMIWYAVIHDQYRRIAGKDIKEGEVKIRDQNSIKTEELKFLFKPIMMEVRKNGIEAAVNEYREKYPQLYDILNAESPADVEKYIIRRKYDKTNVSIQPALIAELRIFLIIKIKKKIL